MGLVNSARDPQISFFNKTFIKNRSYGTIHTFKSYFATVFSVFNNKQYPNRPYNWYVNLLMKKHWTFMYRIFLLHESLKYGWLIYDLQLMCDAQEAQCTAKPNYD